MGATKTSNVNDFLANLQKMTGKAAMQKKQKAPTVDMSVLLGMTPMAAVPQGTSPETCSSQPPALQASLSKQSKKAVDAAKTSVDEAAAFTASFLPSINETKGRSAGNSKLMPDFQQMSDSKGTKTHKPEDAGNIDPGIAALIERAIKAKQSLKETPDIAERVMSREQSDFTAVFQNASDTGADDMKFHSAESFHRTKTKTGHQKVAAYIRVSTDSSDQENSYETQERYFNQLLTKNVSWISAGIYSDYGLSGTNGEKRTGFKRILRHCKEGKIDRIVCKSISRFARNTSDFMVALRTLHDCNVTIMFEKEALDTADPTSDFILTTLGAIAQEESRSISGNIRWGMQKRFPKGEVRNQELYGYRYNGKTVTTDSGYQYKDIEIVEEEARVVRRIFRAVADGMIFTDISKELNREHIPAPESSYSRKRKKSSAKGQLNSNIEEGWTARHISQMVRRERYVGDVLIQKTYTPDYLSHQVRTNKGEVAQYLVKDHHPAIIDRELYEEVQKVVGMNANWYGERGKNRKMRAFSGRLICAECGRYFNVRNTQSNPIWFCPSTNLNNGKTICHSEKVYEEQIVRMFRKAVSERFHLTTIPVLDDVKVADIMSGRFGAEGSLECTFSKEAAGFVAQMLARLEDTQRLDYMERDRSFLKRQISAAGLTIESARKRIRLLASQKESLETRKYVLGDESISDEKITEIEAKLAEEKQKLAEEEAEEQKLVDRMNYLEGYWEELEEDFERREKAIEWMKELPEGQAGVVEFLNGMTDEYAKAFVLSVTVHSPLKYTIHWFDDTRTEVEMHTNIEDFRYTASYFDGQCMRDKQHRRI